MPQETTPTYRIGDKLVDEFGTWMSWDKTWGKGTQYTVTGVKHAPGHWSDQWLLAEAKNGRKVQIGVNQPGNEGRYWVSRFKRVAVGTGTRLRFNAAVPVFQGEPLGWRQTLRQRLAKWKETQPQVVTGCWVET